MIARYEIAHLLFITDNRNAKDVEAEWKAADVNQLLPFYVMADALIAAGYEKPFHAERPPLDDDWREEMGA